MLDHLIIIFLSLIQLQVQHCSQLLCSLCVSMSLFGDSYQIKVVTKSDLFNLRTSILTVLNLFSIFFINFKNTLLKDIKVAFIAYSIYQAISINAARGAAYGYLGLNLIDVNLKLMSGEGFDEEGALDVNGQNNITEEDKLFLINCSHQISWLIGLSIIMIMGCLMNLFIACAIAKIFDMKDYMPLRYSKLINHADFCFSIVVLVFSFFMLLGYNDNCGQFSVLIHFYLLFFWIPISLVGSIIGIYIIWKFDITPLYSELSYVSHIELTTSFGQWETF